MAELHIDHAGKLTSVVEPAEDSQYARDLEQVRERLATGAQGQELATLLEQETTLLLCLANLRWYRAMTQLQAEGVLACEVGQRPLALGRAIYYADTTRDNYYKIWWQGECPIAVERIACTFFPSTLGAAWVTIEADPGFYSLPPLPMLRDPGARLHFKDYNNMLLRVVNYPRYIFTFNGRGEDYLKIDTDASGTWRSWGQGASGPPHSLYVPARDARLPEFTQCRVCGCTNDDCQQCIQASGQPCSWAAPYLCSRCYAEQKGEEVPSA